MFPKTYIGRVSWTVKFRRAIWEVTYFFLFRPFGTKVFRLWRIFLLRLFGAKVDWGAEVYASARIWAPWNLEMEYEACLGPYTICYNQAAVIMRERSCLSQYAYICTAGHSLVEVNNAETSLEVAPVLLEKESWIGTRAFIGAGVCIGKRAVVGAAAAVFKDVEPWCVVGGNPAVVLKYIKESSIKR